ncbi:ATP-binding protein [Treponema primitia]|uniref:response regulator n=1 Tax=Treponema primitia TaxID=88058 RepID=UPI0039804311
MFFKKFRENREARSLCRIMLEAAPLACSLRDTHNNILDCNKEALRIFGLSKKSELVDRFSDLNPEFQSDGRPSREKAAELLREVLERGYLRFNWLYHTLSGDPLPVELTLIRVPLKNTYCIAAYSRDLRETLANRKEIRDADERTRLMLDATPLACSLWDEQRTFLDCNSAALKMFGLSSEEEYVKYIEKLSPPFQSDGMASMEKMEHMDTLAFTEGFAQFEWMHCTLSGEPLPVETTLVRVPWKGAYAMATYSRDLRADRIAREMEVQARAAQSASESKSRFLASMSHEIRTPMNAIIGMSDLMRTDNLDITQKEYFEDIKKMSRALLQIINDILDFSKIEAGKMDISPVHFNLHALYDNICSMSRFTAASKELDFRSHFDDAVPQVLFGDDIRLRQIIVNIVNNAIKYTREGFVDFRVCKITEDEREYLAFIVKDSGIGIKKEDFSKIFGSFKQLDSELNRGILGTGLGLSITKKIVDMMNGKIKLESVYGQGSEFTVLLPCIPGNPALIEKTESTDFAVSAENALVLVVDDNQINLKVALAFLAQHNIKADSAANGLGALRMVQQKNYDLVFMDHMMPGMDGVEATKRIRAMEEDRYKTLPIIALSANAVTGANETFINAGMNDFISKPIDPNALNQALLKWLPPEKVTVKPKPVDHHSAAAAPQGTVVLNKFTGLEKALGDEDFYKQLLTTFRDEHGSDAEKLQNAAGRGDRKLAHRIAHTLKSSAALIGADIVSQAAALIEKALADDGPGCPPEKLQELEVSLKDTLTELDVLIRMNAVPEDSPAGVSSIGTSDTGRALALAETLIPLMERANTGSLKYTKEIREVFPPLEGKTESLISEIENFEFKTALGILLEIRDRLKNSG